MSVDDVAANKQFAEDQRYPFLLLCDPERKICIAYGAAANRMDKAQRITYLIGKDGKVAAVWKAVKVVTHAETVLKALG